MKLARVHILYLLLLCLSQPLLAEGSPQTLRVQGESYRVLPALDGWIVVPTEVKAKLKLQSSVRSLDCEQIESEFDQMQETIELAATDADYWRDAGPNVLRGLNMLRFGFGYPDRYDREAIVTFRLEPQSKDIPQSAIRKAFREQFPSQAQERPVVAVADGLSEVTTINGYKSDREVVNQVLFSLPGSPSVQDVTSFDEVSKEITIKDRLVACDWIQQRATFSVLGPTEFTAIKTYPEQEILDTIAIFEDLQAQGLSDQQISGDNPIQRAMKAGFYLGRTAERLGLSLERVDYAQAFERLFSFNTDGTLRLHSYSSSQEIRNRLFAPQSWSSRLPSRLKVRSAGGSQ